LTNNLQQNATAGTNQNSTLQKTSTDTGNTTISTFYTDLNQVHHTTPVDKVSLTAGSADITVDSSLKLRVGMTLSGPGIANGTTILAIDGTKVRLSKPALSTSTGVSLSADSSSVVFLKMTADGYREDTTVATLTPITAPSAATGYQIGMSQTVPGATGNGATPAAGGAGAAPAAGAGAAPAGGAGA
jgi:hypothetical protein